MRKVKETALMLCFSIILGYIGMPVPVSAAENVALGKFAFGNGMYMDIQGCYPSNATDGNEYTYYASGETRSKTMPETTIGYIDKRHFLAVDLEGYYDINSIIVRSSRSSDNVDPNFRTNLTVCVANDIYGEWKEVGKRTNPGEFMSDFEVSPRGLTIPYRYVIVYRADFLVLVSELEVYGTEVDFDPNAKLPPIDTAEANIAEEAEVLDYLGIMSAVNIEERLFQPNWLVTREQAAELVLNLINVRADYSGEQIFVDVPPGREGYNAINTCAWMGICNPGGQYFRPDDYVTVNEFLKLTLSAVGYEVEINSSDSWFAGVSIYANRLGLMKHVSSEVNEYLSRADAAKILYNALIAKDEKNSGVNSSVKMNRSGSVLETVYKITCVKGIVTANHITNLTRPAMKQKGYVEIDEVSYFDTTGKLANMLGQQARCFVNEDDEILLAFNTGRSEVTTLKGEFIKPSGARTLSYDDGDKRTTYTLPQEVCIIKNGSASKDWTIDDLAPRYGWVDLISSNGGEIDVVMLYEPKVMVVSAINVINEGEFELFGMNGEKVSLSGLENVTVRKGAMTITLESISYLDMVYVCEAEDGKSVYIEVVRDSIKSTAEEVSDYSVLINGQSYEFSTFYKDYADPGQKIFDTDVTYILDREGKVAYISKDTNIRSSEMFGFVVSVGESNQAISNNILLRIFCQDNQFRILTVDSKTRVDGKRLTETELAAISEDYFLNKPCVIQFNEPEERLVYIDTPNHNSALEPNSVLANKTQKNFDMEGYVYSRNLELIMYYGNMELPLKSKTTSFVIPRVGGVPYYNDEEFKKYYSASDTVEMIVNNTNQINTLYSGVYAFYGAEGDLYPSLAITYHDRVDLGTSIAQPLQMNENSAMVVDKVSKALDGFDETFRIHGFDIKSGSAVSLTVPSGTIACYKGYKTQPNGWRSTEGMLLPDKIPQGELNNYIVNLATLKRGDVLGYAISNNLATSLEQLFSVDEGISLKSQYKNNRGNFYAKGAVTGGYMIAPVRLFYGTIKEIINNVAIMEKSSPDGSVATETHLYKNLKNLYILNEGKLIKSSADALASYVGSNKDGILLYSTNGVLTTAIVYEY